MTKVNGQPYAPPVAPAKDKQIETKMGDALMGGAAGHPRGNTHQGTGGHNRSNSSVLVSQSALEQLLETPQQRQNGNETPDDSADKDTKEDSTQVLITLSPDKMGGKETPALQSSGAANQQIKTEEIANLMSRRMDAALRSGPVITPLPISLSIPLDPATGLKGVHVMMNDGMLSVTVLRSADEAAHDIKLAALNLAQVLQTRYPSKTIKVSQETDDSADVVDDTAQAGIAPTKSPHMFDLLSDDPTT